MPSNVSAAFLYTDKESAAVPQNEVQTIAGTVMDTHASFIHAL